MSVQNFIPTIWSDMTLDKYDEMAVFRPLLNTDYEGDIRNYGDTVKINSLNDTDTTTYSGTVTYTDLDDASRMLLIDQQKYIAKQIDDIDEAQAKPKTMGKIAALYAQGFLRAVETFVAGKYTEAGITSGSTASPTSITSANVISTIGAIATSMDVNDVPDDGRVAVVPPWLAQKMVLAGVIRDTDNSAILSAGYIGQFQGFQVYKSNRISHSSTTWYAPMFFRRGDTIAFAEQLNEVEAIRLENSFKDGIRQLMVYGGKVLRPESLAVLYCASGLNRQYKEITNG